MMPFGPHFPFHSGRLADVAPPRDLADVCLEPCHAKPDNKPHESDRQAHIVNCP